MQHEDLFMERADNVQMGQQMQMNMHAASGVVCPHCGTINDPEAVFCASCGSQIGKMSCPNCGAELDADADFCETCRRYVRKDPSVVPISTEMRLSARSAVVREAVSSALSAIR